MCGRFGIYTDLAELVEILGFELPMPMEVYGPRWNIASTSVRGIDEQSARTIIRNREWNGLYESFSDLVSRSGMQRKALQNLVKAGACDDLQGIDERRLALWEVGLRYQPSGSQGRLQLDVGQDMAALRPAGPIDLMTYEYEILGLWTKGHVMSTMRDMLAEHQILSSKQLDDKSDGERVAAAGKVLIRQQPLGRMVFMTLEDEFDMIALAVPPATWKKHRDALLMPIIIAEGEVSRKDGTMNITVHRASPLIPPYASRAEIPDIIHNFR